MILNLKFTTQHLDELFSQEFDNPNKFYSLKEIKN